MQVERYPLDIGAVQVMHLPESAQIMTVAYEDGQAYVYALVDPAAILVANQYFVYGTGEPIPDDVSLGTQHVGSMATPSGMKHVFGP